jgi:transcriptional regulator GlxA family with amidase domain
MVTVSILTYKNALASAILDTASVFSKVNEYLIDAGKAEIFNVQLVGFTHTVKFNSGSISIQTDAIFEEVKKTDLIVIPSFIGSATGAAYINKDCAVWISKHYKNGTEVASLCTGAFLLAYTGILNGKQCTTHWAYANEFRYFYPGVDLVDEKMITDQEGLYSSGGNNAYWNLLIHLVEKYTNREMAIRIAKYFVIDIDKNIQSPFVIFHGQKDHDDKLILKAQKFIEQNYSERFTVDDLAEKFHLT